MAFTILLGAFAAKPGGLTQFEERWLQRGDAVAQAHRGNNTEMAGFLEAAAAHGWAVRHSVAAAAVRQTLAAPSGPGPVIIADYNMAPAGKSPVRVRRSGGPVAAGGASRSGGRPRP